MVAIPLNQVCAFRETSRFRILNGTSWGKKSGGIGKLRETHHLDNGGRSCAMAAMTRPGIAGCGSLWSHCDSSGVACAKAFQ